jgi:hypothetical protein
MGSWQSKAATAVAAPAVSVLPAGRRGSGRIEKRTGPLREKHGESRADTAASDQPKRKKQRQELSQNRNMERAAAARDAKAGKDEAGKAADAINEKNERERELTYGDRRDLEAPVKPEYLLRAMRSEDGTLGLDTGGVPLYTDGFLDGLAGSASVLPAVRVIDEAKVKPEDAAVVTEATEVLSEMKKVASSIGRGAAFAHEGRARYVAAVANAKAADTEDVLQRRCRRYQNRLPLRRQCRLQSRSSSIFSATKCARRCAKSRWICLGPRLLGTSSTVTG